MKQIINRNGFVTFFTMATYLMLASQLQAASFSSNGYNRTYNNNFQNQNSAPAAYLQPPQIITVANTQTGTSIVIGGTVVPLREVTLTA